MQPLDARVTAECPVLADLRGSQAMASSGSCSGFEGGRSDEAVSLAHEHDKKRLAGGIPCQRPWARSFAAWRAT